MAVGVSDVPAAQAIATWARPLDVDDEGVVVDVTERAWAPGRSLLRLHQLRAEVDQSSRRSGIDAAMTALGGIRK